MDELILQTLSGAATPSVEAEVQRWRDRSPENEARYQAIALVWTATAPEPLAATTSRVDPQRIIEEAERRRAAGTTAGILPFPAGGERRGRERPGRRRTGWRAGLPRGLAIAAGLAAIAISVRLFVADHGPTAPPIRYTAGAAGPRTVTLADGSFVRLAAGSTIEVRETAHQRAATLTGRAFFAVAQEADRPFIVHAGTAEARVLGTRFEVARTDGTVRTIVLDGRVAVSNAQGTVEVSAGSVAEAATGTAPTTRRPPDIHALLDWPGGILLFQGTPLGRVAEEVARYFDRTVAVETAPLQALRISGTFEDQDFQEVVGALCETTGAICRFTPDGAVISPAR